MTLFSSSLRALGLALLIGSVGGTVFFVLRLPLPWMLGAMAAVTAAALGGLRPSVPGPLRMGMLAVLGVMLGSGFTPDLLEDVGPWVPSLAGLFVLSAVTPFFAAHVFRRFGGADRATAYFAGTPGGINEMVAVGAVYGGDVRTIALVHALRILIVVFTVPIWFRLSGDISAGAGLIGPRLMSGEFAAADLLWLVAAAVAGRPVGRLLRLPAAHLTGPMALSAAVHLAELTALRPPAELVAVAQVVVGSALGCRFVGAEPRRLVRTAWLAVGSSAVMLALAAGLAGGMAGATGLPFILLLLAYVPGGVAEMSLIALALGMDVAFVALHHMVRIVLVVIMAPVLFRLRPQEPEKQGKGR